MTNLNVSKGYSGKFQNSNELFEAINFIWNYVSKQEIDVSSMKRCYKNIKNLNILFGNFTFDSQ